ncbi:MAG: DUF309 domain-containing protein [Verrucomicrobiota bacterium]|nr:DUF309 domain-containing protein [Verrucomicrobiota bacterium]MEE2714391.1 DUF309 domain-containing protein [Verrucomicrobiota bacterium]
MTLVCQKPDIHTKIIRVSHKTGRINQRVAHLKGKGRDARYLGFFECFNAGDYYEAHDVLEDLWLESRGLPDADFYKALIQLAGGFVHLTIHDNPKWPAAGSRLRPAHILLSKARAYLEMYPDFHHGLDLTVTLGLIDQWCAHLEKGGFKVNPLPMVTAPNLSVD